MDEKLANAIWERFITHKSMLMQPKKKDLLKPTQKPVNFLGSESSYKTKFLEAMKDFNINDKESCYNCAYTVETCPCWPNTIMLHEYKKDNSKGIPFGCNSHKRK